MAVGQGDHAGLEARELQRGGQRLAHDALRVLGRGQPDGGARQPLRRRGGADRADVLQPRAELRGVALDLGDDGGVDRGQRLDVQHAHDAAVDDQRAADLGAHAGNRGQVVRGVADVLDDRDVPGAVDAPDDPGPRRQPVEDLPRPADGLAAQAALLGEVDDRQQPAAGQVVDDRLARVARRVRALQVALEAARGRRGARDGRRRRRAPAATPRPGGRRASPGRSRSPSRAAPRAPRGARRPRRRPARRPHGRTRRSRAAPPRASCPGRRRRPCRARA